MGREGDGERGRLRDLGTKRLRGMEKAGGLKYE